MDIQDLEKLIKGRRSVRRWKKEDVPEEFLKKAVELATWAPNGGNYQGWRFVVVQKRELIAKMANAVQSVVDQIASWPEAESWREEVNRYRKNASFFRDAPVCIGVFSSAYQSPLDKVLMVRESIDPKAKEIMGFRRSAPTAVQSVAAAVATMLLVLHSMGLGAVWMVSPIQAKKEIEALLNTPPNIDLICLVAVGYPDESPQKGRRPVKEVLEFIS